MTPDSIVAGMLRALAIIEALLPSGYAVTGGEPLEAEVSAMRDMIKVLSSHSNSRRDALNLSFLEAMSAECNIKRVSLRKDPKHAVKLLLELLTNPNHVSDGKNPVIFTDLRDDDAQSELAAKFGDVEWLVRNAGHVKVGAGPPLRNPYLDEMIPLANYVQHARRHPIRLDRLQNALYYEYQFKHSPRLPEVFKNISGIQLGRQRAAVTHECEFAYQPSLLGLPWHRHSEVANEVVSGRKHWLFYPPTLGCSKRLAMHADMVQICDESLQQVLKQTAFMDRSRLGSSITRQVLRQCRSDVSCASYDGPDTALSAEWILAVLPELPIDQQPTRRCSVWPGELIIVPPYWWHLTVNIQETVMLKRQPEVLQRDLLKKVRKARKTRKADAEL